MNKKSDFVICAGCFAITQIKKTRMEVSMNNNDISELINMINKMDKNQLANGINQLNHMLSNEDKQRIIKALNNQNKHQ